MRIGNDGNIISLHGEENKLHANAAVQRYVHTYTIVCSYTDVFATIQFPFTLTSRLITLYSTTTTHVHRLLTCSQGILVEVPQLLSFVCDRCINTVGSSCDMRNNIKV